MALNTIDAKMLSKMFLAGAKNLENKKEWIEAQKVSFTNWVNKALAGYCSVSNIETDFKDGLILITLFENLRKVNLTQKYNKQPKSKAAEIENITIALDFIKEDGVKLVNIGVISAISNGAPLIIEVIDSLLYSHNTF